MPFLEARSLLKTYRNAEVLVPVLNEMELTAGTVGVGAAPAPALQAMSTTR